MLLFTMFFYRRFVCNQIANILLLFIICDRLEFNMQLYQGTGTLEQWHVMELPVIFSE